MLYALFQNFLFLIHNFDGTFVRRPKVSDLERYILSKNPQTPLDVDYWTSQYDRQHQMKFK